MKKLFTLTFLIIFILFTGNLNATTYYFSAAGNDSYTSAQAQSQATPWKSISKLNSIFSSLLPGDVVLFNKGDVFVGSFNPGRSGTSSAPITIGAYGSGANPIFSGGTTLTSWTSLGNGIFETALATEPKIVAINGQQYAPGRYPNSGWLKIDGTNGSSLTSTGLSGQSGLAGASVVIRMNRFVMEKLPITSQSGSTIDFATNGYSPDEAGYGFFITNKQSTLDQYGEWFYDAGARKLKVYFGSSSSGATASITNEVISINGKSNISFSDIDIQFANTNLTHIENSSNISFNNCGFKYAGITASLLINGPNTNVSFVNCNFSNINSDGLKFYSSNNVLVQGCTFTDIGMLAGEGGVNEYRGIALEGHNNPDSKILNNTITNSGYCAISTGGGANVLIKNNVIHNFCYLLDDGGGIYIQDLMNTPNKRITGNIIITGGKGAGAGTPNPSSNQAFAIYSDAGNSYTEIDNNTISDCGQGGFYMDDSKDINFHHNTLFDNIRGIAIEYQGRNNGNYPIENLKIKNNICVNKDGSSTIFAALKLECSGTTVNSWGIIDSNYWCRPLADNQTIYTYDCGNGGQMTLPGWQSNSGYDAHSKKSPITVSNASMIRFEYNETSSNKVVSLSSNYMAINGTVYSGSVTLAPFSSIVLLQTSASPTNQLPTANAGADKTITLPTNSITQVGSGTDPDGTIASYQWTKIAGPTAFNIVSPTSATTVINNLVQGTYQFQLKVTDNQGATATDVMTVTVNPAVANQAPVSNAGTNQNITLPVTLFTLTGSGTDADGTIASYQWTKVSGPLSVTIALPNSATTTGIALLSGVYEFELKVTDDQGAVGKDTVTLTVNAILPNQPPVANAGADKNITLPTNSITQVGSGTDPDGTIASYQWTKIAGPATFTIVSPTSATTVINNLVQGTYQFELKVTDNSGATATDVMIVTVNAAPANQLPTANAGADRNITLPTNSITQTGSGTDPDGTIASYQWTKIAGPATFTIASPTQATTVINNLVQGTYQFELKVTDNSGATATDVMIVTVNAAAANQPPTADAGADRNITLPTNSITQTGSGTDPDGTIASYQWTKIAGPTAFTIVSPTSATTVINNLVQGTYQFELKVTDNSGATATDVMIVTVNAAAANQPPTADAGADKNITLPTNSFTQVGSGTDPDGTIASYQWTKIAGPATFTIASPTQATTVINNLVQGTYQFELKVTDNNGATATDVMIVTVNAAPANQPPTANAGADRNITLPTNSITQTGSGTDPDGTIASYQWTKIAGPATFTIVSPTSATTVINNLVQGTYQFELKVTDNSGATATDVMIVTVNAAPANQPPTANAGADRNITLPTNSFTQVGSGTDPDGTIASYQWTKIAGPTAFTIVSPTSATTVINNLVQGTYQFELKVTDNSGATATDVMIVTVNAAANQLPTADAGTDKTIRLPTNSITQVGSGTDPDGTIASYQWTKIAGPATFTIVSPTSATTVINNLVQGTYQFELKVTDNSGASATDVVVVTVNAAVGNQSPKSNAGGHKTITLPSNSVTQNGSGTDPDGTITSYQWTKISGPATYTIASPTSATTTINNLGQGTYQFELKVTDDNGAIATDVSIITVNTAVAVVNQPPTVNAGADSTIILPDHDVILEGTATDPDNNIVSYSWRKVSGPSQHTFSSVIQGKAMATGLVEGVYVFELKATDAMGATGTDLVQVTVLPQAAEPFVVRLYPNPASTTLTVEINAVKAISKTSIEIFDMSGKMITHKEAGRNQQLIVITSDVNKYPAGTYFVRIKADNHPVKTLTFVKQ